ncbi:MULTISPECIES: SDR family NAD(P)-dependent oxidoreductase [Cyanophyceae]|jgi:short-subunit dehydrogenase|uniref:Short-chain dehydrogenase n=1 Tax=Aphanothece cf. minutissima CCALA 015 TaxID=2107695 RepID=A0ABX5FBX5_9CHRO|nr:MULTISPECIES: SDR family NAD(P)-dependent oxidoreductase [Cyanophyceae]MCP9797758.1 SDR family NAD(P)-dependent oxidoreductase [Cyanobium sp. Lug-B]PSB39335.1 short-chain dehydrogenase [Aphanothece cf. minutissima CCALA 015]
MSSAPTRRQRRFLERYGPWAVVTGASSGIGRALAVALAEAGLNLVLVARDRPRLETLAASLMATHGVQVQVIAVDLARDDHLGTIRRLTDPLDVGLLVASAGFGSAGPFLDADIASETGMLMVNGRAVLQACHHFGRRFRERGRGGLVLLSSIAAFQGMPYAAHYAATKAYVQTLAEALHEELRADGVDVLAAAPGPTHSGFAARAGMALGMALEPEAIAPVILAALGRQVTVLPGALSKLLSWPLVPLPRWARVSIMGSVMQGMALH